MTDNSELLASIHALGTNLSGYGQLMREATERMKRQRELIDEMKQEIALLRAALKLTEAQRDKLKRLHTLGAVDVYTRAN